MRTLHRFAGQAWSSSYKERGRDGLEVEKEEQFVFGGWGKDGNGIQGYMNDLWVFRTNRQVQEE